MPFARRGSLVSSFPRKSGCSDELGGGGNHDGSGGIGDEEQSPW